MQNWLGGLTSADATLDLMAQGGIPVTGLTAGGKVVKARFEHVWVEAWVDYTPSLGVKHLTGDTWIALDASYKQYNFTQGMNLAQNVPLNSQTLLDQIKQGATINEAEGWVQNLNQTAVQTALTDYQNRVKTYVDTQKANATVGDVVGTQTIIADTTNGLAPTLPYAIVATGSRMANLADSLRWQFKYALYADITARNIDSPIWNYSVPTARIAGKKITLSFKPATQADADTLASYLPQPHADGSPITPEELPQTLPGYLINVSAELRVDGQVVATGGSFMLGQELITSNGYFDPARGWNLNQDDKPNAGEYRAIALDLQGVSQQQLEEHKAKLAVTKGKLEAKQLTGLTADDLSGDTLYAAALIWFAVNDCYGDISQISGGIVDFRAPSMGSFMTQVVPNSKFGVPLTVRLSGLLMDITLSMRQTIAKDYDSSKFNSYNQLRGQFASNMEHAVPESLFTDQIPSEAVSAAKAINVAATQGKKIYTITSTNIANILPQISHRPAVIQDIQNAVSSGKAVVIPQTEVTVSTWTGSGYIIQDTLTGTGSFILDGANGGNQNPTAQGFNISSILSLAGLSNSPMTGTWISSLLVVLLTIFGYLLANMPRIILNLYGMSRCDFLMHVWAFGAAFLMGLIVVLNKGPMGAIGATIVLFLAVVGYRVFRPTNCP